MRARTSSNFIRSAAISLAIATAGFLALASAASATVFVDTAGTDSGACGASPATACATIQQAVTNAAATDTIEIGPGTFHTGTANGIIVVGKNITFHGAGEGVTFVNGDDATTYGQAGTFRFNTGGTTQTLQNLSISNFGRTATSRRYAIFLPGPAVGVGLNINNVEFVGPNDGGGNSTGLEVTSTTLPIVINGLTTSGIEGNALLLQNSTGQVLVQNSHFDVPLDTSNYSIVDALFGAATGPTTAPHEYLNNTFDARTGITIQSGFFGSSQGKPFNQPVNISGNTFTTRSPGSLGIEVSNNSNNPNTGVGAGFTSVNITNNVLTGNGGTTGIQIAGLVNGLTVSNNDVRDYSFGLRLRRSTATNSPPASAAPTGVFLSLNQIVGNVIGLFIDSDGNTTGATTNNWWGCNGGPGTPGCDSVSQSGSGVDVGPWAVLTIAPAKTTLGDSESTAVTAAINTNAAGAVIPNLLPDGTALPFDGTNGDLVPDTGSTTSSAATTTFTSSSDAGRSVSAKYDNQLVTFAWPDFVPPTPEPTPTPGPTEPLPACAKDVAITNVAIKGSRYAQISGLARVKYAGQQIRITYKPTRSRVVARPVVAPDGTFTAVVRRPAQPPVGSNNARYRATLGSSSTPWTKLSRRLITSGVVASGGVLHIGGRVTQPIAPGRRVAVTRSDQCGKYRSIGTVSVARSGKFAGRIPITPNADGTAAFIRLNVKVRRGGRKNPNRQFTTYSIVQPVPIR